MRCLNHISAAWDLYTSKYRCERGQQYAANLCLVAASMHGDQTRNHRPHLSLFWSLSFRFFLWVRNRLASPKPSRRSWSSEVAKGTAAEYSSLTSGLRRQSLFGMLSEPITPGLLFGGSWQHFLLVPLGDSYVIFCYCFAMIEDFSSPFSSVSTADWLTIVARHLLWSARKGRLLLLPNRVRRDRRGFEYYAAVVLQHSSASVSWRHGHIFD